MPVSPLLLHLPSVCKAACSSSSQACCMQVGAIIVSPTRELARQTYGVAQPFVQSVPGLQAMLLVGGTCAACPFCTQAPPHSHVPAPLYADRRTPSRTSLRHTAS